MKKERKEAGMQRSGSAKKQDRQISGISNEAGAQRSESAKTLEEEGSRKFKWKKNGRKEVRGLMKVQITSP